MRLIGDNDRRRLDPRDGHPTYFIRDLGEASTMTDDEHESRQQRLTRELGTCRRLLAAALGTFGALLLVQAVTAEGQALAASGLVGLGTLLLVVAVCVWIERTRG